jgi:cholesterol oxidase
MRPGYDVVVIGSGFGGAISSCRLAQAGRSVCLLERGKRWEKTDFPGSPAEVARSFWQDGRSYGFLEYKCFRRVDVIQGCGLGGGSLHYFNVHLRTPGTIFEHPIWPLAINRAVLDAYYALAEDMLDSNRLDPPPAGFTLPYRTRAFLQAATAAGAKPELVPLGVNFGPARPNPHSGIPQETCNYSGNCLLGCNLHAKNTLDLNYIALAQRNGADVYPLHQVDYLEPASGGGYRVHYRQHDPADPGKSEAGSVLGRTVILAAGTLGTNQLLLRCRERGTLPQLSPSLGTRFSTNGDFILAGTMDADREVDPGSGPSITAGADFSTSNNRILIEDLGYPEPFMWMLEGAIPREKHLANIARQTYRYVMETFGWTSGRLGLELGRLLAGGATTNFLPYLGMGTDAADGILRLKNGTLDIQWDHRRSRRLFAEIEDALKRLSAGLHGKYITSLLWRWPLRKLLTAHPLGGCPMGDDPERSVTNHRGEVWGHPGLYVADASLIPSALAANPSLTISALAERVAFWMIHGREMTPDDSRAPLNH